jgi:hypothetical protein
MTAVLALFGVCACGESLVGQCPACARGCQPPPSPQTDVPAVPCVWCGLPVQDCPDTWRSPAWLAADPA